MRNMAQTSNIFQNEKIRPELQAGLEKINFKSQLKCNLQLFQHF